MQPDHTGASPTAIDRLADTLFDLAGHQHVRTIEALAAVLTRRSLEGFCERPAGLSEPAAARPFTTLANDADGDTRREICRRIARRALRGSLVDPTRGANAVHRIDDIPAWSREQLPIGMFGPFLFYRMTPEQVSSVQDSHSPDVWCLSSPQAPQNEAPDPSWWPGSSSSAPDWMTS
jgi:hypothetical protein